MNQVAGQSDHAADYWRDGFVFPLRVMSESQAAALRADFESMESRWKTADLPRPFNDYLRYNTHIVSPLAWQIATTPAVVDAVEGLLGPDLLLWAAEIIVKEPGSAKFLSWHQDLTYWGFGETQEQVTAWIALSPATLESGCMQFVAGSHAHQVPHKDTYGRDNILSRGQEVSVDVDPAEATTVALRPGEMSLHHGLMFHASGPNISDDRRIGVVLRFMAPGVRQRVAATDFAMMVRGMDRNRNFVHLAPPETEFSARSLALYEEVARIQDEPLGKGAERDMSYDRTA